MEKSWKVGIWKEGKYFDLWHVNHFLAGVLMACATIIFKIDLFWGFVVSFILMVAWEFFEYFSKIHETMFNRCMDVILSTISFILIVYLEKYKLTKDQFFQIFYVSLVLYIFLELWGFRAYQIAKAAKARLIARAKLKKELKELDSK